MKQILLATFISSIVLVYGVPLSIDLFVEGSIALMQSSDESWYTASLITLCEGLVDISSALNYIPRSLGLTFS